MVVLRLVLFMYVCLLTPYTLALYCADNPIGMQNHVIPHDKITASSGTAGDQARLDYTKGPSWCAMGNDTNPYLQIDLGTPQIICAVATQGGHQTNSWVKTFRLSSSDDGVNYKHFGESNGFNKTFYGNVDSSGIVKQFLYKRILARYLRILPKMHHGAVCLRAEVYGVQMRAKNWALNKEARQTSTLNNEKASRAVDGKRGGNCASFGSPYYHDWWKVDLDTSIQVAEVSVYSNSLPNPNFRETPFELRIGYEGKEQHTPTANPLCGGQYSIVPAGSITIVCDPPMEGRYVFIRKKERKKYLSLCEVEVYGRENFAFGKPVIRSHYNLNYKSTTFVTDGYVRTCAYAYASSTPSDKNAWFEIDLHNQLQIDEVYVRSHGNKNLQIFVRDSHSRNNFCGNMKPTSYGSHVYCQYPLVGRYLIVKSKEATFFSACEVEVYGKNNAKVCDRARIDIGQVWESRFFRASRIEIDLKGIYHICAVATKGNNYPKYRTEKYKMEWSINGSYWERCKKVFTGNIDSSSIVKHIFNNPLTARKLRLYHIGQNVGYYLRVEVYGVLVKEAEKSPSYIGDKILSPRSGSYVDLVCRANGGLRIKWYFNDTDITGYSNGTVRSRAILISRLRINHTSADDVYDKYSCGEVDDQKRNCTSLEYICQVDHGSYRKPQGRWTIFTELRVPTEPNNIQERETTLNSALIRWKQPKRTADQGNVIGYKIKIVGGKRDIYIATSQNEFNITSLEPYTSYKVRIKAVSRIGESYWSKTTGFTTGQPETTAATKNKDKRMEGKNNNSVGRQGRVSNTQDNTSSMVIAIAVVFSLLIVIAIAMVIFILWYKRRRRSPKSAVKDRKCQNISIGERNLVDQEEKNPIPALPLYYYAPSNEVKEKKSSAISVEQFSGYMSCVGADKYEVLIQEFQILDEGKQFPPSTVAKRPVNKMKNRYGNIVPYDTSRVVLEKLDEDEDSDYVNASYIWGFNKKNISYIASQGPLKQTIVDFWRMIWQERTSVIVMLTGLIEGNKTKCEKYWPDNYETYHDLTVKLQKTEVFADYSIRTFFMSKINTAEQRYVFQYHFTSWPDKGVPQHTTQLLAFRKRLVSDTAMESPWVVHCSAGVGRTGAFLAIDAMLRQAQEMKTIDIFNYVNAMRKNRPYMVQTAEQYTFVHMAILEHLTCGVTEIQTQQLPEKMKKLAQIDEKENLSGYEMEFKHLSDVCPPVQDDEIIAGNKRCNSKKNRFQHIVPLDKERVILQVDVEEEGANYINASYANGYRQKDAYILTQAPLDNTIADFWNMIYERRLGTVVMLNNLREGEMSFPKYWPEEGSLQYGDITVEIMQEEEKNPITLRTLALTHKSDEAKRAHEVRHYQHTEWSDGSAPNNERTVLDLIEKLQRSQQQSGNKSIVVQCSDGVGRSGTLCAILSLLDRVKTEQMVDVFQTVKTLRISRPGVVETAAQYEYCFQLVMSYLDSFSDYSNFNG